MNLPVPNLDDRSFAELVAQARAEVARSCPQWTDLSVHDPGVALIEVFAHLTEVMLYRLNRLPEKAYVEFLNLLGVTRYPPAAASVELLFTRTDPNGTDRVRIPAGTAVVAARGADPQPVTFVTTDTVDLPAGQGEIRVPAYHCEVVTGELLGVGTGLPGQVLRAGRAPMATTTEAFDVLLGVEARPGELPEGAAARDHAGRTFELWPVVPTFAEAEPGARVFVLDRTAGTVTFAPAIEGYNPAVPPAGREIRLWYRTGGGPDGNVAAGTLTALREPIAGLRVTNPLPARGGRAMESAQAAITRGPHEFFALRRAITARDFELLARAASSAVVRAKAFTRTTMRSFARPGEVEVVLVPHVGPEARPDWRLPVDLLAQHEIDAVRERTQLDLDGRRALGTRVVTSWARYKAVSVRGRVVVAAHEDADAVRRRINARLYQTVSPLPTPLNPTGWAFGEPLRASNVYRMLESAEPGVRYVDEVRFAVDEAPDGRVRSVAVDRFQADTWYAGCGPTLFRSTNGGNGWEPVGQFPGEEVRRVLPAPAASRPGITARPGLLAVVNRTEDGSSALHISADLGETWTRITELEPAVADINWVDRDGVPALLCATDVGLYEVPAVPGGVPLQVLVDDADADLGFTAVRSFVSARGVHGVALAAQARGGVYLSVQGGRSGTFTAIGMTGVDVRTMEVQLDGPATVLWVGAGESDPSKPGQGCSRARLFEADVRWERMDAGWSGGTCWDLDFAGDVAFAGTHSAGVLRLPTAVPSPQWQAATVNSGLPLRDRTRFEPVECLAALSTAVPGAHPVLIGGGTRGVYRSTDGTAWGPVAHRETRQMVTIPDTWLLCSGEHDVEVVREDATSG